MFAYQSLTELLTAEKHVKRLNREANFRMSLAPHSSREEDELFAECQATARICDAFDTAYGDLYELGFRDTAEAA